MEYKQSLARRIVIAFMLMTVAVGGLFSAGIVGVVHIIEERLISRDLGGELSRVLSPREVADIALAGVQAGELYIPTHPAWKSAVGDRFSRILQGFDGTAARLAE